MKINPETFRFKNPRGFIVLEGVNGAGKSTLQRKLVEQARNAGREAVATFEPGSTDLGKQLRKALLENESGKLEPMSELFLFCADRHEHVRKVIEPALASSQVVVCDRFHYSTTAFQGYGRGLDLRDIAKLTKLAVGNLVPDLVILLDLDPLEGLKRNAHRVGTPGKDSFEAEELDFHKRLRQGFLETADRVPEPFLIVNAAQAPEQVFDTVVPVFEKLLGALRT